MIYEIVWLFNSELSFYEEIDFIYRKWNKIEVKKFEDLVDLNLLRLAKNPNIGIYHIELGLYYLVISKQTKLYYSFDAFTKIIELHLFWNNLKNPEDLIKLL